MLMGFSLGTDCVATESAVVGENGSSGAGGRDVLFTVEDRFFPAAAILSSRLITVEALSATAVRMKNEQEVI